MSEDHKTTRAMPPYRPSRWWWRLFALVHAAEPTADDIAWAKSQIARIEGEPANAKP